MTAGHQFIGNQLRDQMAPAMAPYIDLEA